MNSGKNNKLWNSESYKKTNTFSTTKKTYLKKTTGTMGGKDTQTGIKIKKKTNSNINTNTEKKNKKKNIN